MQRDVVTVNKHIQQVSVDVIFQSAELEITVNIFKDALLAHLDTCWRCNNVYNTQTYSTVHTG